MAFSLVEMVVAAALTLTLLGVLYAAFIWTWKGFLKGDDTVTTVYDASILLLNLRRDLLRMDFPVSEPVHVTCLRGLRGRLRSGLTFEPSSTRMVPATSVAASADTTGEEGQTEMRFFQRSGDDVRPISYSYFPDRHLVLRKGGIEGGSKTFSFPRLRNFDIQVGFAGDGRSAPTYFPAEMMMAPIPVKEIWVKVRVHVQSERKENQTERTSLELSTMIFPKRINGLLRSRWGR